MSPSDRELLGTLQLRCGTASLLACLEAFEREQALVAAETDLNVAGDHMHVAAAIKIAAATASGAESKRC